MQPPLNREPPRWFQEPMQFGPDSLHVSDGADKTK